MFKEKKEFNESFCQQSKTETRRNLIISKKVHLHIERGSKSSFQIDRSRGQFTQSGRLFARCGSIRPHIRLPVIYYLGLGVDFSKFSVKIWPRLRHACWLGQVHDLEWWKRLPQKLNVWKIVRTYLCVITETNK